MDNNKHDNDYVSDMGQGFARFIDRIMRGRSNKTILHGSVGLSLLDTGWPKESSFENFEGDIETTMLPFDVPRMLTNNSQLNDMNQSTWSNWFGGYDHPMFDLSSENFTLFGLDFPDMMRQFAGKASEHHTPIYNEFSGGQSLAETIGLPDLPYMEMAHLAHMGMALYDTGRTFQDVWKQLGDYYEKHNTSPQQQGIGIASRLGKTITHPEMLHTLAARGTMLTVMGLLHPLGGVIAIGVAYLCAHLVHSAFGVLERNKETIRKVEDVPVLAAIYGATGMKEWAERDQPKTDEPATDAEKIDPFTELELTPERDIQTARRDGRLQEWLGQMQERPA